MSDAQKIELEHTITVVGTSSSKLRDGSGDRKITEQTLKVTQVREGFSRFLAGLREIIDVQVPVVGDFELEEVQFTAEISANGEFKLLGSGVGVDAKSGVTFTLRRKTQSKVQPDQ